MNNFRFSGIRDNHLNVFYNYGEHAYYENNVTKAFINTIESLNEYDKKNIIKELFHLDMPNGFVCKFYLQRKPEEGEIKSVKEENRIMYCFSPTGKCWGIEGIDQSDFNSIFLEIKKEVKFNNPDISDRELNNKVEIIVKDMMNVRKNTGSLPDAWLMIYMNDKPYYIIAFENKLDNLDPYQIKNHIKKSLFLENSVVPIYENYESIINKFKKINSNNYLIDEFIEYMIILGHHKLNDFGLCFGADYQIRQKLCSDFGESVLENVYKGKIDKREWNIARIHVNFSYLKEINLRFSEDKVELSLAFGSTQNSSKEMLKKIDKKMFNKINPKLIHQTLHVLYQRGRNISYSYLDEKEWDISDYIDYWQKHIEMMRLMTPIEMVDLYRNLFNDGKISEFVFQNLKSRLESKKNKVIIVPEIIYVSYWSYNEIENLGLENFCTSIKQKINEAFVLFNIDTKL